MLDCHFNSVANRILPHSEILQLGESFIYMATHGTLYLNELKFGEIAKYCYHSMHLTANVNFQVLLCW